MRLIPTSNGFLAVQPIQSPRGRAHAAGWGTTRLEAMAACVDLVAALDAGPR